MSVYRILKSIAKATIIPQKQGKQQRVKEQKIIKREVKSGFFGGKPYIHRSQFRKMLRKAPKRVPGGGVLTEQEKLAIEKEVFPQKEYGSYITTWEFKKGIRHLKRLKGRVTSPLERMKLRRKIRFLESLEGKENEK
jgi:hypothetical protein